MNYQLTINLTAAQVQALVAGSNRISIAKSNNGQLSNVAWLTFYPSTSNVISWNGQPGIYGTLAPVLPGIKLMVNPFNVVGNPVPGGVYQFRGNGFFRTGQGNLNSYTIQNATPGFNAIAGLYQRAILNGQGISGIETAVPVGSGQSVMQQINEGPVYLWLDNSGAQAGTFIYPGQTNAFDLNATGGQLTLGLNANGSFVQM